MPSQKKSIAVNKIDVPKQQENLPALMTQPDLCGTVELSESIQSYNPSLPTDDDNEPPGAPVLDSSCNACNQLAKGSITHFMTSEKFLENNPDRVEGFNLFDNYSEGYINSDDLGNALIAVGYFVTESELETVCRHMNISPSSHVDFRQFMSVLAHQMVDRSDVQIMEAFRIFDKEGKGSIDSRELKHIMTVLGVHTDEEQIDDMIREVDVDGDGDIDFQEFVMMIKK